MPRKPRIHYPGAFYHVMARGNEKKNIFFTRQDREYFYFLLNETALHYQYRLHGFCLMSNHVHLVIEVGNIALAKIMQNICFRYTRYINNQLNRVGHLFQGRYRAILIEADNYLLTLIKYVHLNPIRAGIVTNLHDYSWSSHSGYLGIKNFSFLTTIRVLEDFHNNPSTARQLYQKYMLIDDSCADDSQINFSIGNQKKHSILCTKDFLKNLPIDSDNLVFSDISLEQVVNFVCKHYLISSNDLKNIARKSLFAKVRASIAWLAFKLKIGTTTDVARYFQKDLTTLIEKMRKLTTHDQSLMELNNLLHLFLFLNNPRTQA